MTATLDQTYKHAGLSRKQLTFQQKYANVPAEDLTDNIRSSWTRPIPSPLNGRIYKVICITILLVIVGSIVGILLGTPDMSGLYYLLTQTNSHIKAAWDGSLPDPIRHDIRDNGIGALAGLWIVYVVSNRYKVRKPLTKFDKWEMNLHIGSWYLISNVKDDRPFSARQLLSSSIAVLPYAAFGYGLGKLGIYLITNVGFIQQPLVHFFNWLLPVLKTHTSTHGAAVVDRVHDSLVDKWPGKVTGLLMAFFFGRRPVKGTMDDIQLWLCQQRFLRNAGAGHPERTAPWYYLPNWRATFNDVKSQGAAAVTNHGDKAVWIMRIIVALAIALGLYGWYVLLYIAHK